jgi:hypothetical protein
MCNGDVSPTGDDDSDFLNFEEPSKVPLLPRLIPAEKAFDHPRMVSK